MENDEFGGKSTEALATFILISLHLTSSHKLVYNVDILVYLKA